MTSTTTKAITGRFSFKEKDALRKKARERLIFSDGPIDREDVDEDATCKVMEAGNGTVWVQLWVRVDR